MGGMPAVGGGVEARPGGVGLAGRELGFEVEVEAVGRTDEAPSSDVRFFLG